MLSAGYNVQLDVLNATVSGLLQNSSLPAIQVAPPTSPIDPNPSGLLMTLAIESESLMPFNDTKRWIVTGVLAQVSNCHVSAPDAALTYHIECCAEVMLGSCVVVCVPGARYRALALLVCFVGFERSMCRVLCRVSRE